MIYTDGYRLSGATYHELRTFMDKHGFNPEQVKSEHGRIWVYCEGWQSRLLDRAKGVKKLPADEFNRRSARLSVIELRDAREAYEHLMSIKVKEVHDEVVRNGATYKREYRATGERDFFIAIQERRSVNGLLFSEISGKRLITDNRHPLWVSQFMHCLPKGSYGRYRLLDENVFLGTVEEHRKQTVDPGATKLLPEWAAFWERYEELKQRYHAEI